MERNIAVVGAGFWGKNLVRNFYELGVLHTICDADKKREGEYRSKYPDTDFTQFFSQVLDDPQIDGVVVSTPASYHYEMAREALLAGKHVFVEKPLALQVDEGKELVKLARERVLVLMVGHILQYHPAIERLKGLIEKGELGKIQYIYSNRLNIGKIRSEENILWSFAPP